MGLKEQQELMVEQEHKEQQELMVEQELKELLVRKGHKGKQEV
jgi:hypothetical protein